MHHRQDAHQKGSDNSASARVSPQFQSRPFGLQAQSETTTPQQQETPDDETQLERAKRFGPDFSRVRVRGEGPPPTIQSKLFFGEQEEPVTDAIAQPVRSMPAPRINLRPIPRQDAESVGNQPNPLAARMMPPIQRRDAESVGNQPNPLAARMMPPIPRQDAESVGNQPNPLAARMMPVVQRQPQPIVSIPRQSWIQRIEEQPEAKLEQEDESAPVQAKLENATVQRQSEANVEEEAEDSLPVQTQLENATVQRQSEGEQESENEDHSMQLVQPKLTVGAPGDKYEIEADSMAERVMSMNVPDAPAAIQRSEVGEEDPLQRSPIAASITPLIHRQDDEEDVHSQPSVQRAAEAGGFQASSSVESGLASQQGGGSPLDEGVRSFMEPRFGNDFSSVRIHTGSNAVQMNKELHAQAFTHGSNIYFNAGRYNPGSNEGKRLLAHELTHVVQQTGAKKLQQKPIISLKSNKQTAQAKQLPGQHPKVTTSNEQKTKTPVTPAVGGVGFSGSLGLSIQAKADPGQILEQLKNTPPTNAPAGYDQAQAAFNKFKIQRQGQRIQLLGHINPWVLLANGSMEFVESKKLETTGSKPPKVGDKVKVNGEDAIVIARNKESIVVSELQKELPELRKVAYEVFGTRGLRNLATKTKTLPKTPQDWIQWAADNPDKVKGLNVQGVVEEYGNAYPEAVNKFLTEWVSGKFTRRMKNSRHVGDLNSLGMPVEVLDRLTMPIKKVNKEEKEALKKLRKLALMMRPSNPAHATGTRDITLAKPTNSIPVPQGTSMHIKDIAKNAKENLTTEFMEVTIKVDEEYRKFAFVHDEGAIRLLPSEQATGLKPATKEMLENNTALIPLPEGNVTTAISSQYTPPVSTGLGDKARGLVGTSLYKDGEEIKYLVVSRDKGKTYYLEEAKNVLDEKGNIPTNSDVMIVGSDIDLLAILSPNGEFNNIAAILDFAKKHPETFNALLEAFRASKRKVAPLEKEGKTFKFPSPASDIQHGPQIPYLIDELLQRATQGNLTREELKQMPRQELQQYISKYREQLGEKKFRKEVEAILGTADVRTVLTIKGKIYTIPVRDVPMLYKLLGHEFPIAAYLPL